MLRFFLFHRSVGGFIYFSLLFLLQRITEVPAAATAGSSSPSSSSPGSLKTCLAWRPCAAVSTDHGDALAAWMDGATAMTTAGGRGMMRGSAAAASAAAAAAAAANGTAPLSVLHVDFHADISVPGAPLPPPHELRHRWRGDDALRLRLAEAADLASFQLSAVWAGLVDQIIWVRPVHRPVDAHERADAQHHRSAADAAVRETHLLFYNRSRGSGTFETLTFEQGNPAHARERAFALANFDAQGIHHAEYAFEAMHIDLLAPPPRSADAASSAQRLPLRHDAQFILDIDLDFFIPFRRHAGSPPWAVAFSSADPAMGFGELSMPSCGENIARRCPRAQWADTACPVWQALLAVQDKVFGADDDRALDDADSGAAAAQISAAAGGEGVVAWQCLQELHTLVVQVKYGPGARELQCLQHHLNPAEWVLWAKLVQDQPRAFHNLLRESTCVTLPKSNRSSSSSSSSASTTKENTTALSSVARYLQAGVCGTEELQLMVDQLGRLLTSLLPKRPVMITVARSTDYWTPVSEVARVELSVLQMLQEVYGQKAGDETVVFRGGGLRQEPAGSNGTAYGVAAEEAMCARHQRGATPAKIMLAAAQWCSRQP